MPVNVQIPPETAQALGPGAHVLQFRIKRLGTDADEVKLVNEKSTFVVPR